jgi:alpha-glucosidase (family GH31 glycosyl hydrolase)
VITALRPLFLEFPNDFAGIAAQGEMIDGTLMFGPDFLLSPITEYNATSWDVYLPKLPGTAHVCSPTCRSMCYISVN